MSVCGRVSVNIFNIKFVNTLSIKKNKSMKLNSIIKYVYIGCVIVLCSFCKTEKITQSKIQINNKTQLDSITDSFVDNGAYPFLYVRVEDIDGKVVYEHGKVNKDLVGDKKVDGDTWIRIWSMSKIVTITTFFDLVEDGLVKLDDPVTKFIPEFKNLQVAVNQNGQPVAHLKEGESPCPIKMVPMEEVMTIEHLLNHQAGFYYAFNGIDCIDKSMMEQDLATSKNTDEFIQRLIKLPLIHQPGAFRHYGTNTTVLGMVAERASGKTLKQLVEERMTGPMKIEGLQYGLPDGVKLLPKVSGQDTVLRIANDGELDIFGANVPFYDPSHTLYLGGEGMLATADGYLDFLRMFLKKGKLNGYRFLDEASILDIQSPHTQLDNKYGYNGYNLWVSNDSMRIKGEGDKGLLMGAGYEGTHFWMDPKRELVGVIMSQIFMVPPNGYGRDEKIRGAMYQQFFREEAAARN